MIWKTVIEAVSQSEQTVNRTPKITFVKRIELASKLFVVMVAVLILTLFVYQRFAQQRDIKQFPLNGKLYEVNGQTLHLFCLGTASSDHPTAVLESGRLSHSMIWETVMETVSQSEHICVYDRPGLGWSTPSPHVMTPEELTLNLHDLLVSAEIEPPYVLVGHSMGGILVRDFAQAYPDKVVGMVLVDSSVERQRLLYPGEHLTDEEIDMLAMSKPLFGLFSHLGGFRLYHGLRRWKIDAVLTEADRRWLSRRNQSYFGQALVNEVLLSERLLTRDSAAQPLGDMPLFVLEKTPELATGATSVAIEDEQLWQASQQQLVRLSTHAQWVASEDSGHDIPTDDPELVVLAIETILNAASVD